MCTSRIIKFLNNSSQFLTPHKIRNGCCAAWPASYGQAAQGLQGFCLLLSLVGSVGNLPSSRRMCNMLPWLQARSQNMDAATPLEATRVNISGSEASHREEGRNSIFGEKPPPRGWWQPFPSSFHLKLTDMPLLRNFPVLRFFPFLGFFLQLLVSFDSSKC